MQESKTISIEPTRSEQARVIAYILAGHASVNPDFFGPYWELNPAQEGALFGVWKKLDALNVGEFKWFNLPASHKAKLIKSIYKAMLEELTR